jgi:hypothetical protein
LVFINLNTLIKRSSGNGTTTDVMLVAEVLEKLPHYISYGQADNPARETSVVLASGAIARQPIANPKP